MRWHAPEAFLLLLAVLAVGVGYWLAWRRKKRLLGQVGDPELLARMAGSTSRAAQAGRLVLMLLALGGLVVAMARPQLGGTEVRSQRRGIDLVIALDISRSMLAQDVRPSRLQAARLAIEGLLPKLVGSRVGLVGFAGVAFPQTPLTSDSKAIRVYLEDLTPELIPVGGTALGRAIHESVELLTGKRKQAEAEKIGRTLRPFRRARTQVILLLTDGEDHQSDPLLAADEAAAEGIRIYTVGLGTATGEPVPIYNPDGSLQGYSKDREGKVIYSRLDEGVLAEVARKTGGLYLPAQELRPLTARLTEVLDSLEKEALGDTVRRHMDERYAFPLVPALLLLGVELLLGDRRRRRVR
ncbi:MAG: VWA domain-containing protein [Myxococcota bacterium]|jgi:Ca-activated chloride channel family protein|nr:VWA domain-containing protein [Myxococcota bacterium]